jgi:hypothetical protein
MTLPPMANIAVSAAGESEPTAAFRRGHVYWAAEAGAAAEAARSAIANFLALLPFNIVSSAACSDDSRPSVWRKPALEYSAHGIRSSCSRRTPALPSVRPG